MKGLSLKRIDEGYTSRITVIVPTYNEVELIERKLDDIYQQNYPRDRIKMIIDNFVNMITR